MNGVLKSLDLILQQESSKHCYDVSFCFYLFIKILIIQMNMIDLLNASISQLIIPQSFS